MFGRFTGIVSLDDMDCFDAQNFYPDLLVRDKIAFCSVFGGSPHVLSKLLPGESLEANIKKLLSQNSLLRTHRESVRRAQMRKGFSM